MKAKEIQELIDFIAKSGLDEVNIETEEFKIKVKKNSDPKKNGDSSKSSLKSLPQYEVSSNATTVEFPAQENKNTPVNASKSEPDESKYKVITSPMIGTFYRSANPGSPYFVNVGDKVTAGQTVCIVEAMKLFNEIESELTGTVVKILVENATPVEYDQPLFLIDPA